VLIVLSKGPDLVAIPDIIGQSINKARQMLQDAGFAVEVSTNAPKGLWDFAIVQSYSPGQDTGSAKRGTTITIVSNYD
jgi:eukaryotic-like serine/threonine-protein kinase